MNIYNLIKGLGLFWYKPNLQLFLHLQVLLILFSTELL